MGDHATIREIGIRCDRLFSVGSTKGEELSDEKYEQ